MEENQSREQYFFEDETLAWLGDLISRTERVAAIFMPSLLHFPNVQVFDADERFAGSERYTLMDVTRTIPELSAFGMVLIDPPFALSARHLAPLLSPALSTPLLISATDWCVACAGWGDLFARYGLMQVTTYFPRYRSIGNGYCESTLKRDGRTNISFFSNVSFAPPRRPVVLQRESGWTVFDPYDFTAKQTSEQPPQDALVTSSLSASLAKADELRQHWATIQHFRGPGWRRRMRRWLRIRG